MSRFGKRPPKHVPRAGAEPAQPEVPGLSPAAQEKKEKERKSGAAGAGGRWAGSEKPIGSTFTGARGPLGGGALGEAGEGALARGAGGAAAEAGAAGALRGAGAAYTGAWRTIGVGARQTGLWRSLLGFLSNNSGMVLLTVVTTALAAHSLYSLASGRPAAGPEGRLAFDSRDAGPAAVPTDDQKPVPSSLGYFKSPASEEPLAESPWPAREAPRAEAKPEEKKPAPAESKKEDPAAAPIAQAPAQGKPHISAFSGFGDRKWGSSLTGTTALGGAPLGGRPFDRTAAGDLRPYASEARKMSARSTRAVSGFRGKGPMDQLRFANRESRKALGMSADEGRAYEAAEAFTPGSGVGAGKGIEAGGMGTGGAGLNPSATSGGLDSKSVSPSETPGGGAPSTGQGEDKSPWTADVILAMALLMTASALITLIGILALMKNYPVIGQILQGFMMMLYVAATGCAMAATILGAYIMTKHGQMEQGAILTTGGAITSACAVASLAGPGEVSPWVSVLGGIAGMAAAIGSLLAGMMKK